MHSFTFNGHSSDEFGIRIERFPDLNRSARKFNSASVAGRNGNIYQIENAWEEVTVSYQIFAGERQSGAAVSDFTDIVEWLNSANNYAELTDTYDPTHYRMAVFVDEMEIESEWHTFGKATINFRCKPQRYIVTNDITVTDGDTLTNPTNHIAHPLITISGAGSGPRSLLDMLNKTMSTLPQVFSSPEMATLVSEASNDEVTWIKTPEYGPFGPSKSIRFTGTGTTGTLTSINNSTGTVSFTPESADWGIGFVQSIIPNASYTITANNSSGAGKVVIWFGAQTGYNDVLGLIEQDVSSGGVLNLTFTTPEECGYILFGFFKTSGQAGSFSNIMLVNGTEAKPFRPYVEDSLESISIADITLYFSVSEFGTAIIDCETENLSIDGVDSNSVSYVVDQYGNVSPEYLRVPIGTSAVALSSGLSSAIVKPRTWEL